MGWFLRRSWDIEAHPSSEERLKGDVRSCCFIVSSNIKTGISCTLGIQSLSGEGLKQSGVVKGVPARGRV